jgi:hypothetical protein
MCQAAMNVAAFAGPATKPLMPNTAMPPGVHREGFIANQFALKRARRTFLS